MKNNQIVSSNARAIPTTPKAAGPIQADGRANLGDGGYEQKTERDLTARVIKGPNR